MFEKYDGIRGFWHPHKKCFFSRLGNVLPVPKEVTDDMPSDIFLDGELWYRFPLFLVFFLRTSILGTNESTSKVWAG